MLVADESLKAYTQGKGVFVESAGGNDYRLINRVAPEAADYVLVKKGLFGSTKYDPILLKEWFYALKVGGFLLIPVEGKKDHLMKTLSHYFSDESLIIQEEIDENNVPWIILKKEKSALRQGDEISKWTFGIITNGKRNEAVEEIIKSIQAQNIPNYEIIVCGTYKERSEPNFKYIHFSERDDRGWITKKKNLICEAAQYENLCIIHDRLVFDKDWYKGFQTFGNYFDAASCVQLFKGNLRVFDWYTKPPGLRVPYTRKKFTGTPERVVADEMGLHYEDWDPFIVMNGGLTILKKSIWEKNPWDEARYWNDSEDVDISHRITKNGGVIRFNRYSRCDTLYWRHSTVMVAEHDTQKLGQFFVKPDAAQWRHNFLYYMKQDLRFMWINFKKKLKGVNILVRVVRALKGKR